METMIHNVVTTGCTARGTLAVGYRGKVAVSEARMASLEEAAEAAMYVLRGPMRPPSTRGVLPPTSSELEQARVLLRACILAMQSHGWFQNGESRWPSMSLSGAWRCLCTDLVEAGQSDPAVEELVALGVEFSPFGEDGT